jgi:hypothetical protein
MAECVPGVVKAAPEKLRVRAIDPKTSNRSHRKREGPPGREYRSA